jgi:putative colanic acid biosynthesis acetyltransferase WcaF
VETRDIAYAKNYTKKEYLLRALWSVAKVFFRGSPRLMYGWRNSLLRLFGASIGEGVKIYPSADIMFPWNFSIGDHSVVSWKVVVYNLGHISIGSNTIISQYAHLCAGTHDYQSRSFDLIKSTIIIGNGVWISADAFIGPDVEVSDQAVVAARAVVVKDVGQGEIVAGNPARVVKRRIGES